MLPHTHTHTVSLHRIAEVREGQETEKFHKFPYEEVESQSFSLLFDDESGGKYVRLTSLDLICDHIDHYQEWMEGVSETLSLCQTPPVHNAMPSYPHSYALW